MKEIRHLQVVVFLLFFVLFLANNSPFTFIIVTCTWTNWGYWLWIINKWTFLAGDWYGTSCTTIVTTKSWCINDVNSCLITEFYGCFTLRWWQFTVVLFLRIAQGFWCVVGETIFQWNQRCWNVVSLYIRVQRTTTTYLLVAAKRKRKRENVFYFFSLKSMRGKMFWRATVLLWKWHDKIRADSDPILTVCKHKEIKSDNKIPNLTLILFKETHKNNSGSNRDSISDFGRFEMLTACGPNGFIARLFSCPFISCFFFIERIDIIEKRAWVFCASRVYPCRCLRARVCVRVANNSRIVCIVSEYIRCEP